MVATFDWPYKGNAPEDGGYWNVTEGAFRLPWNLQIPSVKKSKKAWAEEPSSINEVGSTYTIQGFDLNYVGVILGPSVRYTKGKGIWFDKTRTEDAAAIQAHTGSSVDKDTIGDNNLRNALNVLIKRGVHGLYLHAVDKDLQAYLNKMTKPNNFKPKMEQYELLSNVAEDHATYDSSDD
jgi:DUF2075 family protein